MAAAVLASIERVRQATTAPTSSAAGTANGEAPAGGGATSAVPTSAASAAGPVWRSARWTGSGQPRGRDDRDEQGQVGAGHGDPGCDGRGPRADEHRAGGEPPAAEVGGVGQLRAGGRERVSLVDDRQRGEPAEPRRLAPEPRLEAGAVQRQPGVDDRDGAEDRGHPGAGARERQRGEVGGGAEHQDRGADARCGADGRLVGGDADDHPQRQHGEHHRREVGHGPRVEQPARPPDGAGAPVRVGLTDELGAAQADEQVDGDRVHRGLLGRARRSAGQTPACASAAVGESGTTAQISPRST